MWSTIAIKNIRSAHLAMFGALFPLIFSLVSCKKVGSAPTEKKAVQKTFATPALVSWKRHNPVTRMLCWRSLVLMGKSPCFLGMR
jgi:hypothetical protein